MDEIFKNTCYNKNSGICHKAAAERAAAEVWELSDRERGIVEMLSNKAQ